jgi:hypothetical protein
MAFEFEVLNPESRVEYGINNDKIWSAAIDKTTGWILVELPKHPQQIMYGDYAIHFLMYYQGKPAMKFSLDKDYTKTDGVMIYQWSNLHAFSGWGFVGESAAIEIIKEALTAYGAGSSFRNKKPHVVDCNF